MILTPAAVWANANGSQMPRTQPRKAQVVEQPPLPQYEVEKSELPVSESNYQAAVEDHESKMLASLKIIEEDAVQSRAIQDLVPKLLKNLDAAVLKSRKKASRSTPVPVSIEFTIKGTKIDQDALKRLLPALLVSEAAKEPTRSVSYKLENLSVSERYYGAPSEKAFFKPNKDDPNRPVTKTAKASSYAKKGISLFTDFNFGLAVFDAGLTVGYDVPRSALQNATQKQVLTYKDY